MNIGNMNIGNINCGSITINGNTTFTGGAFTGGFNNGFQGIIPSNTTKKESHDFGIIRDIYVSSIFSVEIVEGDKNSVEIEISENCFDMHDIKCVNGMLTIDLKPNTMIQGSPIFSVKVTRSIPSTDIEKEILRISASNASNVKASQLKASELTISAHGASTVIVGNSDIKKLHINAHGSSTVKASVATEAIVEVHGAANVDIRVLNSVIGKASGASTIIVNKDCKNIQVSTGGVASIIRS